MKVKAALVENYGDPAKIVEDLDLIDPRANEVRIKIAGCGICHSDIAFKDDEWKLPTTLPLVLGHEGAGVVESVGTGVTKVKVGDKVALSIPFCGECDNCVKGLSWMCEIVNTLNLSGKDYYGTNQFTWNGKPLGVVLGQGSLATYCVQHINNLVKLPDDFDIKLAGPLGCGFRTGAGAVYNDLRPRPAEWLAVIGTGSVGMAAMWMAKAMGAKTVMVDINDRRLQIAKELGADSTVNSGGKTFQEIAKEIMAVADGKGVHYTAETTGRADCHKAGMLGMRAGGVLSQISNVGAYETSRFTKECNDFKTIAFNRMGNVSAGVIIPVMIDLYKRGLFPMDKIIKFYQFEQVNEAMADSASGKVFKPVVLID